MSVQLLLSILLLILILIHTIALHICVNQKNKYRNLYLREQARYREICNIATKMQLEITQLKEQIKNGTGSTQ